MMQNTLKKQVGLTAISWMILIVMIGFLAMFGLKLFPVYMENFSVSSSLKSLKEETNISRMTPSDIQKTLLKRFRINNVERVSRDNITVEREHGEFVVNVYYEVQQHFVANIDFLITFDDTVRVPAR